MKTKFISLFLVLAILITVGGVYAAWMYTEAPLTAIHGHVGSFGLSNAIVNNSKGTFKVNAEAAHLVLEKGDGYVAELQANGTITFTFTASDTYMELNHNPASIGMHYSLVTTNTAPLTYKCGDGVNPDKELFTTFTTNESEPITLTRVGSTNEYTATIQTQDILDNGWLAINTFTLDSYAKYEKFSAGVGGFGNIGIQISETAIS